MPINFSCTSSPFGDAESLIKGGAKPVWDGARFASTAAAGLPLNAAGPPQGGKIFGPAPPGHVPTEIRQPVGDWPTIANRPAFGYGILATHPRRNRSGTPRTRPCWKITPLCLEIATDNEEDSIGRAHGQKTGGGQVRRREHCR